MRRVACFYRVSTTQQLDDNDIPMQRRACQEFIKQQQWTLVEEYVEKGVSGYKISANDRDEIQRAKKDAEKGKFDILLCFMFDRLGRRDDETPFVLEWFSKKGVELWSVKEGQQKFADHTDKLINYIRFWQSSGESQKTSMRVSEKLKQMTRDGEYRGGIPPYGYSTIPSGSYNKKGKELLKLVINDDEEVVVKYIYNLSVNKNMGNNAIAKELNDHKYPTRKHGLWHHTSVNGILKNPMYKGVMKYDTGNEVIYSDTIDELRIISIEIWELAQQKRNSRIKRKEEGVVELPYAGRDGCLTIGSAYCGHCGKKMIASVYVNKQTLSNGQKVNKKRSHVYRCTTKMISKTDCDGQTSYAANKIDPEIEKDIINFLRGLGEREGISGEREKKLSELSQLKKYAMKEKNKLNQLITEKNVLQQEIPKALTGTSAFSVEILSDSLKQKDSEILEKEKETTLIVEQIENIEKKLETDDFVNKNIPTWIDSYNKGALTQKKLMMTSIIDKVFISKNGIDIQVKLNEEAFIATATING